MNVFLPLIDTLIACTKDKLSAYKNIADHFNFFTILNSISTDTLRTKCLELKDKYNDDIDFNELFLECKSLASFFEGLSLELFYIYTKKSHFKIINYLHF